MAAPGGYGKTTALAQAIRDNDLDPSGIDVYVRCHPWFEGGRSLVAAAITALDASTGNDGAPLAGDLLAALARRSPVDVCLILDDVHHLESVAGSLDVLDELVRGLPFNAHLVLAGRGIPDVPLARLRASDDLLEIGPDHLAFDADELATFAHHHGVAPTSLASGGGWPAVTRLTAMVGAEQAGGYLLEEFVGELSPTDRSAIVLARVAGTVDDEMLGACGIATNVADLLRRVPLLVDYGDGTIGAHDLWGDLAVELVGADEHAALSDAVARQLLLVGDAMAAVDVALRGHRWGSARTAMMAMLGEGDTRWSVATTSAWMDAFPPDERDTPEYLFLRGVTERLAGHPDRGLDDVRAAGAAFRERGDIDGETAVVRELGTRSWLLDRPDLREGLDEWGRDIVERGGQRMRDEILAGRASSADLRGDSRRAIELYRQIAEPDDLHLRHMSTLALRLGDRQLMESYVQRLEARSSHPTVKGHAMGTRWMAGDPDTALKAGVASARPSGNRRNEFTSAAHVAMMGASLGIVPDVGRLRPIAWERKREQAFVAVIAAAAALLEQGEEHAVEVFREQITELGADEPLVRGESLRFAPYAYMLSPVLREWLESDAELGPLHRRMVALARALCDARRHPGRPVGDLPTPPEVLAWFPLPWSVELAVRLVDAGDPRGEELGAYLADVAGVSVRDRLRLVAASESALTVAADQLRSVVPAPPAAPVRIQVCGGTVIRHGDTEVAISRGRVRQLLELLVLRGEQTRESIVSALWPDVDVQAGRTSLRVALSHLRRELQPDRDPGEAHFHLRQRDDRIWLHRSEFLDADVWLIERRLRRATSLARARHSDAAIEALGAAIELYHQPVYESLRDDARFVGDVVALHQSVVDAASRIAEHHFADRRPRPRSPGGAASDRTRRVRRRSLSA